MSDVRDVEREAIVAEARSNGAADAPFAVDGAPRDSGMRFGAGPDTDAEPPPQPSTWERLILPVPEAFFTTAPPSRAWLLRDSRTRAGVLPLGKVGQCIAEGGAGKTMAAFQLAIAVATGTPWLGTFDVAIPGEPGEDGKRRPRTGRALVIVGEEDADEAHRRLYRARRATGAPIPPHGSIVVLPLHGVPAPMLMRDDHGEPTDAPFLRWLRAYLETNGQWDLIVVDPLSRFAGPDAEIDNAVATRFVQSLESIATLTGATVIVCHHTNKLSRRGGAVEAVAGRGSSALVDGVRWQCSLGVERYKFDDPEAQARLGEIVTWANPKTNYSRRADDVLLRHDLDNGGALVPIDDADREALRDLRDAGPTRAASTARAAAVEVKVRDDAEKLLTIVRANPWIGTRKLLDKSRLGSPALGRALEALLETGRVENRPGAVGKRIDPHYFATVTP